MASSPLTSKIFPDSEDNEDHISSHSPLSGPSSHPTSPPRSPNNGPSSLFFADSDEEDDEIMEMNAPILTKKKTPQLSQKEDEQSELDYMDLVDPVEQPKQSREVLSIEDSEIVEIDSAAHSGIQKVPEDRALSVRSSVGPPAKKRRLSDNATPKPSVSNEGEYLGSILVPNAWSTTSGSSYIKNGEAFTLKREELNQNSSKADAARAGQKNGTNATGKSKQTALNFNVKNQPKSTTIKKNKVDTVIRLVNSRGSEFGRLPSDVSSWVSKLMDLGIIRLTGSMIDCPPKLRTGVDLLISITIYILPSAFKSPTTNADTSLELLPTKMMFDEGQETAEEQILRGRKSSLLELFKVVGLKPKTQNKPSSGKENAPPGPSKKKSGAPRVRTEVVGDGEKIEVTDEEDELTLNELDVIYRRAQANDRALKEMEPSEDFALTLRPYQKQALMWMHSREIGANTTRLSHSMHPLWSMYAFPSEPVDGIIDLTEEERCFYFNSYSGELSLEFPKAEQKCRGGILADVGMGKTIMVSSLIQTNKEAQPEDEPADSTSDTKAGKQKQLRLDSNFRPTDTKKQFQSKATLIVAPASLLTQWQSELEKSSKKGTLKVMVWHGQNRVDLEAAVDGDDPMDVVITSYGILAAEHAKVSKITSSPVHDIQWFRVVLDEAHNIKSRTSKTAKAVFMLKAARRWALTGTPIVNRLEDLYSLLKFLNFAPWSGYTFFRSFITLPFLSRDPKALEVVQVILESVLLRREKNMRDSDGKRIVELPGKEIVIEHLDFSPLERSIYDSLFDHAKSSFEQLDAEGLVSRRYTHILAMIMRLRRAVLHPSLVVTNESDLPDENGPSRINVNDMIKRFTDDEKSGDAPSNNTYMQDVLKNLKVDSEEECPVCFDIMEMPALVPGCLHQCCKDCILAFLHRCEENGEEKQCPICRQGPVQESELLEVVRSRKPSGEATQSNGDDDEELAPSPSSPEVVLRRSNFNTSTKLKALVQNLQRLQDQDPCFRAVVFSQFTSFLDLIEVVLKREDIPYLRFDGSMDIKKRQAAVTEFNSPSRRPKTFILSLKAGGVGLNLTTANHVFMMDCWWNAAIENQAIDRVHRIGQDKTVYVKHFIIADTIEDRILQIQKRKTAIIKEAFKGQSKDGPDSESVENLKIMFESKK